jgi:ureidoacrylate peracid hydrolase
MSLDWLAPARTALLLIDFQVDFASPDGAMARTGADLAEVPAAIENAVALTAAARAAGVAVIFVRLLTKADGGDRPLCVADTPGADFVGPLPLPGETVVSKSRYSAFAGTGLADHLKGRGIDTVLLAGLTSECCVASTAWHAFELGLRVVIAPNACAAYEPALHENSLRALWLSGAGMAPTSDIVARWK